ncbi:MAG: hypothetical protein ABJC87_13705 [Roseobacter sp.]
MRWLWALSIECLNKGETAEERAHCRRDAERRQRDSQRSLVGLIENLDPLRLEDAMGDAF